MYKLENMDFMDFYFNGKKLSDFGGAVGSVDGGFKRYTLLPPREYVKDRPLFSDIQTIYYSYLDSRTFSVPIFFEEFHDGSVRELAAWLNSPTPSKFYFVGDDVYINVVLDSEAFDIDTYGGLNGVVELKFIGDNPYFYNLTAKNISYNPLVSGQAYKITNEGSQDSYPLLDIRCSGDITIEVFDSSNYLYSVSNVTNIASGVKINSLTQECNRISGESHFNFIDEFPVFPSGNFTIKVKGSVTSMNVQFDRIYV